MSNTVIAIKKSSTPGAVPTSGIMSNGELAINFSDGKLFYKSANGNVYPINANVDNFGVINVNGTLVVADGPGDILTIAPGDNTIDLSANVTTDRITISANLMSIYTAVNAAFDKANAGGGGASVLVSDTSPAGATPNTLWWNTETGRLAILYEDSNSAQWVEVSGSIINFSNVYPIINLYTAEIDFGQQSYTEKKFVIPNSNAANGLRIVATQSFEAATGKSEDENEFDSLLLTGKCTDGNVIIYARAVPGPVAGPFKINYTIG